MDAIIVVIIKFYYEIVNYTALSILGRSNQHF